MTMTYDPSKLWFWAYLHANGHIQLKSWYGDVKDYTDDCEGNSFVVIVVEPFTAATREEAFIIANQKVLDKQIAAKNETKFLIWSIEHGAWWRPNEAGYTLSRRDAGQYDFNKAVEICRGANRFTKNTPHEAMIPAI